MERKFKLIYLKDTILDMLDFQILSTHYLLLLKKILIDFFNAIIIYSSII